ncbi:myb-like protein X [Solea solea]|uniref:myb-like protein X n=1 Tax=Solea solea TaxID=90069 RepID=UPI002729FE2B|nr:myb-like protein X [Solea solea]
MSRHAENITNDEELRIVLVGKTGVGKSTTGNAILGKKHFKSKSSPKSVTVNCDKDRAMVDGQQVVVIDTPGLFDTRSIEEQTLKALNLCINFASPGPHIFLVVIALGRFTNEEKQAVQKIQETFGEAANNYSMVLFTYGDNLDTPIEEYLSESEELTELVNRCNGEYHVFNNKLNDCTQVSELLLKIRNIVKKNGGSHYTSEMFQKAERAIEEEKRRILEEKQEEIRKEKEEMERKIQDEYERKEKELKNQMEAERREQEEKIKRMREEMEAQREKIQKKHEKEAREVAERNVRRKRFCVILAPCDVIMSRHAENITNDEELRIVLVGKTGVGKSTTGNAILGKQHFKSELSPKSVTDCCDKDRAVVDGQQVVVIDTPGVFDTRLSGKQTLKALNLCINFASPGPHIFLVIIALGRFTDEEKQAVQKIQETFGEAANKYSMVLFTYGDNLDTPIEEYLSESEELTELVNRCNGEYHVFNNKLKDCTQVSELLLKIRNIVIKNRGSHYTSEMFQKAERVIEEEKRRILEEKQEEIRKEKEEMERKIQDGYERKEKELKKQMEAERDEEKRAGEMKFN